MKIKNQASNGMWGIGLQLEIMYTPDEAGADSCEFEVCGYDIGWNVAWCEAAKLTILVI